jgi:glyoxylase-like metal-dependent hydrolase (beta-lactamase superfamily II)
MNRNLLAAIVPVALLIGTATQAVAQGQPPERSITHVAGDLYRAQNNNAFTVFLVTPEGIIMTDPIAPDFSAWLKSELDDRFGVPVRYVLYSHHHWDHASGGEVFAETAEFVGHENMRPALALPAGDPPLPANVRESDRNGDGLIQRSESEGNLRARFDLFDMNADGALSGAEVIRGPVNRVHAPTVSYSDRFEVTLAGQRAVMVPTGTAHSNDMSVILFPAEGVLFGADVFQVRRLPIGVDPTLGGWIDAYRIIDALDFDIAVPGHGSMGTKADMTAFLQYLNDLAEGVAAGIAEGKSLEEIQGTLRLDSYSDWLRYDTMLQRHIGQVYAILKGAS